MASGPIQESVLKYFSALLALVFAATATAIVSDVPLDQAARDGNLAEVKRLLDAGANPDQTNKWGYTALTGASGAHPDTQAYSQIVRLLLVHGADVNKRVATGTTALNEAAFWGQTEIARILVSAGADTSAIKDNGWTPLLSAASQGHLAIVQLLLANGADPTYRNASGQTPMSVSAAYPEIVSSLKDAIARRANKADSSASMVAGPEESQRLEHPSTIVIGNPDAPNRLPTVDDETIKSADGETLPKSGNATDVFAAALGISTGELLISFILTWVIGLLPPVLIRFALLRRPINKWPAIATCALFYFMNILIFTALGSQNKTHAVLVVVAFVSYFLLRRGMTASTVKSSQVSEVGANDRSEKRKTLASHDDTGARAVSGASRHDIHPLFAMNTVRKSILVCVATLVVLAGLYAPFEYVEAKGRAAAGYGWLFSPPDEYAVVNLTQVVVAWIGLLLVGGVLWLAATPTKPKE